jgi:hypothetical protein
MVIPVNTLPLLPDFFDFDVVQASSLNCSSVIAIAGLTCAMFFLKFINLYSAKGITLLAKKESYNTSNSINTVRLTW